MIKIQHTEYYELCVYPQQSSEIMTITWLRRANTLYFRPDSNGCQPARFIVGPTVGRADNEPEGLTTIAKSRIGV